MTCRKMFKKFFIISISVLFFCLQTCPAAFAEEFIRDEAAAEYFKGQELSRPVYKPVLIEDRVAEEALQGEKLSKPVFKQEIIEDRIAQETFRDKNVEKYRFKLHIIRDECVTRCYKGKELSRPVHRFTLLEDRVAVESFKGYNLRKPVFKYRLLDEDTIDIEITVSSTSKISTEHVHFESFKSKHTGSGDIDIGENVRFMIVNDVKKDGKVLIRKGTPVQAIIGSIVPSSNRGVPAEVMVERFITRDVNGNRVALAGEVRKRGINLYLLYTILAIAGAPFTFGASELFLYLHGGQAKIKPGDEFTVYYEH